MPLSHYLEFIASQIPHVIRMIWISSFSRVPPLTAPAILLCAIAAAAAVLVTPLWRITRNIITIAHEGGHALVAKMSGRTLEGVHLNSDTSGLTVSSGKRDGCGLALTRFAGYASPPLWGLLCAFLVSRGYSTGALWLLVVLLALMLVRVRNPFGVFVVVVLTAAVIGLSWWANTEIRSETACCLAWFLIFGSIRPLLELMHQRGSGQSSDSDADQLAQGGIPAWVWMALWLLMALGALWAATSWMTQTAGGMRAVFSMANASALWRMWSI
ncbi:MAG: M50 family metallopeptidase [Bifidobacterium sp.]|jgi:hypothetical protein|nr:M50 family metallopeptidase [Bifidobacterium sp.]